MTTEKMFISAPVVIETATTYYCSGDHELGQCPASEARYSALVTVLGRSFYVTPQFRSERECIRDAKREVRDYARKLKSGEYIG